MTDIFRAPQQTQNFPGSRAPKVVEDLDAEENGDSLMPTDRWGKNQDIHFLLFLLFIMFGLLFVIAKAHVMYRSRQQVSSEEAAADAQAEQPTRSRRHKRSQETIEKMIVLKNVFWISSATTESVRSEISDDLKLADNDEEMGIQEVTAPQEPASKHRRKKSNLFFMSGEDSEESAGLQTCPICLCDYDNGEQICWSKNRNCSHHFHATCGIAWLAKHDECPVCRAAYLVEEPQNIDEQTTNVSGDVVE